MFRKKLTDQNVTPPNGVGKRRRAMQPVIAGEREE